MENNTPIIEPEVKKSSVIKRIFKVMMWLSVSLLLLAGTLVSLVFIYEDDVKAIIITELNKNLNAEIRIDPKNIDLTVIKTFPDCALEFKQITCMEAIKSKHRDTLVYANSLQLKFDIKDLWNKKYLIKKIKLDDAFCRLRVNSKGEVNYKVWKESNDTLSQNDSLSFSLEKIELQTVKLIYSDAENKFKTDLLINEVEFSGKFSEDNYQLNSKGNLYVNKLKSGNVDYLRKKNLNYILELDVTGNQYNIQEGKVNINRTEFEANGNFVYSDSLQAMHLNFNGKNLDIQSVLSLLPDSYKDKINEYESSGNFYAGGNINYSADKPLNVDCEFGVKNTTVTYKPKGAELKELNCTGRYINNASQSFLELRDLSGILMNDRISGNLIIKDFSDPYMDLVASGSVNLANLNQFWPIDTLSMLKGNISFNTQIKSNINELKKNVLSENALVNVNASFKDLAFQFKGKTDITTIQTCDIQAVNRNVEVNNLSLRKGNSDLLIDGKLEGLYNYFIDNTNQLKVYGNLRSSNILVEDFIYTDENSQGTKNEVDVPENLNFILDADIAKITFGKFNAANLKGNIELRDKKVMADNITMETMDGEAVIDALADFNGKNLNVSLQSNLKNINVTKLFSELNNFNQSTLQDKNIGGVLNAGIEFYGTWNKLLEADLNSIKATAEIKIDQGKLNDFKPLESLSKFVDVNDLKNIRFSTLQSNIEIKSSKIIIPKTSIKNSALNLDIWGTHTFNNDLDYHIQLLISELLAKKRKNNADEEFGLVENDPENRRSAFILMTGNIDNPVIKYDRKGMKQKIKEDIKQEKQNLKQIFREEFGIFKKDSVAKKESSKSDQNFKLEQNKKQDSKKLDQKKKKEEEDDDF